MCGRYTLLMPYSELVRFYRITRGPHIPNLPSRWNIAPSQEVPAARLDDEGRRQLVMLRWGLIPWWVDDPKNGYR